MTLSGGGDALETSVSITISVFKLGRKWQNVNSQEEKVCKQKYSFFFDKDKRTKKRGEGGGGSQRCYISHAWSGERNHLPPPPPPPPPPEQKCWCVTVGVAFDYVAVQSKAVMSLSHLDRISLGRGNARSSVPRNAATAWQPRFRQRDGGEMGVGVWGGGLGVWSKCTTALLHPAPPTLFSGELMHTVLVRSLTMPLIVRTMKI